MSFTRVRKIGNHSYRYHETRWREGGKVKSKSKCLGPVHGHSEWNATDHDEVMDKFNKDHEAQKEAAPKDESGDKSTGTGKGDDTSDTE